MRPGGGQGNPLQYSCLENPHGQRSLVGYSPGVRKESDTTKQLSTAVRKSFMLMPTNPHSSGPQGGSQLSDVEILPV